MKQHLSPTIRRWILPGLKSLGFTIASAGLVAYLGGTIARVAGKMETARNDLAAFHKKYESLDRLRADYATTEPLVAQLERVVPSVDNFPAVAEYFTSVAVKTSNVVSSRFDAIPTLNEKGLRELAFSLQVDGNFSSVRNLMRELETAPYLIAVQTVSLSFPAGATGQAKAEVGGVLYLKDSEI